MEWCTVEWCVHRRAGGPRHVPLDGAASEEGGGGWMRGKGVLGGGRGDAEMKSGVQVVRGGV